MKAMQGLTSTEVKERQLQYGKNTFHLEKTHAISRTILNIVKEPMFLMLLAACLLYFLLAEYKEGWLMIAAMSLVTGISLYQEEKSSRALTALSSLTEPKVKVIRDGQERQVAVEELVPGDVIRLEEGNKIAADGLILQQNDLTVNEAILTGESIPVDKQNNQTVFQGTTVNSGGAYVTVTATGNGTALGKLGKFVGGYQEEKTALRKSIDLLVRYLAAFGIVAFFVIFITNYLTGNSIIASLLFALTLAMAAIPEEIPVAYTSFMALGAYHLSRNGIITRNSQILEHLGRVSTICLDKTGTITSNKMRVNYVYNYHTQQLIELNETRDNDAAIAVLKYASLASETVPFDEMEKAIHRSYVSLSGAAHNMQIIHEYPLKGQPPMMTHVYGDQPPYSIAAKGGIEKIMQICHLPEETKTALTIQIEQLGNQGFRILGIASAEYWQQYFPVNQEEFPWQFEGFISLYDPPKKEAASLIQQFYNSGIEVKLLTGDLPQTAATIARQVNIKQQGKIYSGEQVMQMSDEELQLVVKRVTVFARMFPEAKIRVIEALKRSNEIVTMIGDGVNDGPAIKAAHIGIAMGKDGTEVAQQAADLVLTDDAIGKLAAAIEQGRKIYRNLNKAIRYIVSIHIPIILTASLPLLLGWKYPTIFTPVHIIFLELIMGPTCSIFYEREPAEVHLMDAKPQRFQQQMFTKEEILISIVQGLLITAGLFILYHIYAPNHSLETVRTILFTTLICSNICLTFTNRSFTEPFYVTLRYKNNLAFPILLLSILFLVSVHVIPFLQQLFGFVVLDTTTLFICISVGIVSVAWFEGYKIHLNEVTD